MDILRECLRKLSEQAQAADIIRSVTTEVATASVVGGVREEERDRIHANWQARRAAALAMLGDPKSMQAEIHLVVSARAADLLREHQNALDELLTACEVIPIQPEQRAEVGSRVSELDRARARFIDAAREDMGLD